MHYAEFWTLFEQARTQAAAGHKDQAEGLIAQARGLAQGPTGAQRRALLDKLAQSFDLTSDLAADLANRGAAGSTSALITPPPGAPAPALPAPVLPAPVSQVHHGQLGPISPEGSPGVSLVTCAMNRTDNLINALRSWLVCPDITEIVIVDWSSDDPVAPALQAAGLNDPRIRLVRTEGEPRWILPYAFNAGFRVARCNRILKVDADIVITPDFFTRNPMTNTQFIAGNWRNAPTGQAYVNGFFFVNRAHLAEVGGFNEFITTYGWDDDDIYARLEEAGAQRIDVEQETIYHQLHSDEARTGDARSQNAALSAKDEITGGTMYCIRRNRFLANVMPYWNAHKILLPFDMTQEPSGGVVLRRAGNRPHVVPPQIEADADYYALLELASWRLGPQVLELDRAALDRLLTRPFDALELSDVLDALEAQTRAAPAAPPSAAMIQNPRPKLFIDGQHGLGNRLRAIGSGAVVAEATDRELVIVWEPDAHCEGKLTDLYDYQGAIIEQAFADQAAERGAHVYNYMESEAGSEKDAPLDLDWRGDIYARSAYVLKAAPSTWDSENRFLRALTPNARVRELVAQVRRPNDLSAHVRMVGGTEYEHLAYESQDNWTEEGHAQTDFWRKKSHFSHFIARIDTLISEGRAERLFLAADKPETYQAFIDTFGDRMAYLPRELYDRSAEQLRYALADALLLGSAPLLLGSTWSSFSELAMRLSPQKMRIEMSGKDF